VGHALSALLLVITVGSLLLQLRTVRRVGTAGLAPTTWFGLLASTLVWLGYGVAMREMTVVVINLLVLAVGIALTVAIVRSMAIPVRRLVPYVAAPASVWAGAWIADAPWLLGVAGTMLVIGRLVPQLVGAIVATDRSGISRGAWLGNGITNVAWAAYGFSTGDPFVSWPSVVSATLSCAIVVLASRSTTVGALDVVPLDRERAGVASSRRPAAGRGARVLSLPSRLATRTPAA
jgi:uncharacterized protein with PQ loop repeat